MLNNFPKKKMCFRIYSKSYMCPCGHLIQLPSSFMWNPAIASWLPSYFHHCSSCLLSASRTILVKCESDQVAPLLKILCLLISPREEIMVSYIVFSSLALGTHYSPYWLFYYTQLAPWMFSEHTMLSCLWHVSWDLLAVGNASVPESCIFNPIFPSYLISNVTSR